MAGRGRHPYPLETMLRVHLMQNWFGLSDPAMEEALYEITPMRVFARLSLTEPIPDETTILNFRHLLEKNELAPEILGRVNAYLARKGLLLKRGSIVDATIIEAPSSTKNAEGERDPEMHQTKKGNQWHFGMKAHIGVDVDSGLVHTVTTTPANEADVEQVEELLHGKEEVVHADAGYTGADKRASSARACAGDRGQARQDQGDEGRSREACDREDREAQGEHPREGRASVPRDQAPVRSDEGALPRAGEEHGACDHAVRAVESVDGATAVVGDDRVIASAAVAKARSRSKTRSRDPKTALQTPTSPARAGEQTTNRPLTGLIRPSLMDGHALAKLVEGMQTSKEDLEGAAILPLYPKCGGEIVRRVARRGSNAGTAFEGCVRYPECRGIRTAV